MACKFGELVVCSLRARCWCAHIFGVTQPNCDYSYGDGSLVEHACLDSEEALCLGLGIEHIGFHPSFGVLFELGCFGLLVAEGRCIVGEYFGRSIVEGRDLGLRC